jgi:hypothetical protein
MRLLESAGFTPTTRHYNDGIGSDDMPFKGIWIHATGNGPVRA